VGGRSRAVALGSHQGPVVDSQLMIPGPAGSIASLAAREDPQPRLPLSQQGLHLLNRQRRTKTSCRAPAWIGGGGPPLVGAPDRQMGHTLQAPQRSTRQGEQRRCPAIEVPTVSDPLERTPVPGGPVLRAAAGSLPGGPGFCWRLMVGNSKF